MTTFADNTIRRMHANARAKVTDHPPKQRSEEYWYRDDLFDDRRQMWVSHTPGTSIPVRARPILYPGIADDDYSQLGLHNIGSEREAYRLYRALDAFFRDERSVAPWVQYTEEP